MHRWGHIEDCVLQLALNQHYSCHVTDPVLSTNDQFVKWALSNDPEEFPHYCLGVNGQCPHSVPSLLVQ